MKPFYCAQVELDGCPITFMTDSEWALDHLRRLPGPLFDTLSYHFEEVPPAFTAPTLRYVDEACYGMDYDGRADLLTLAAPWPRVLGSNLLEMSLCLLAELMRQRAGRYRFHASAVVRDDLCLVFSAPSGGGKTTLALELCLNHGFELYADDQLVVGLAHGRPSVLRGDAILGCRPAGMMECSEPLSTRIFGPAALEEDPWRVQRRVAPEELGIRVARGQRGITHLVFPTLDRAAARVYRMDADRARESNAFLLAKVNAFQEISKLIRGSGIAPFDERLRYVDLFIPSLDTPGLLAGRVALLERLFSCPRLLWLRGRLKDMTRVLLDP